MELSITSLDLTPVWLTLKLASITVFLLLILAAPLAWWLSSTKHFLKPLIEAVVALPLVLPPTVLGFYLLISMGNQGFLGQWWVAITGETFAFSFSGLVFASMIYSLPFVVQPLQTAFCRLDMRSMEAAWTLGASPIRRFMTIVLPQIRHGLLSAIVLGFAHTVGEFGVVLMIGGNIPGETQVVSVAIYEQVESLNYATAHLLAILLLSFSLVTLFLVYRLQREPLSGTLKWN